MAELDPEGELVVVRSLPVVTPPIPDGGGRILGPAGEMTQILNGPEFRFLAYLEFDPRSPIKRGNHYHLEKVERLYVIRGALQASYRDISTGRSAEIELGAGDLVTVPPGCAHVYTALEPTDAVEVGQIAYDPDDTIAFDFG